MSKKEEYIKAMLLENISIADQTIKELHEEIDEIKELPNDCKGIMINDELCENPDYKIDLLTNHYHVIGYMECMRAQSRDLLNLNTMNDEEFEDYLKEQEEIEKHNQKQMEELKKMLDRDDAENFFE